MGKPPQLATVPADSLPTEVQRRWRAQLAALTAALPSDAIDGNGDGSVAAQAVTQRSGGAERSVATVKVVAVVGGDGHDGSSAAQTAERILRLLREVDTLCRALSQRPPPETRLQSMSDLEAAALLGELGFPHAMMPCAPSDAAAAQPLEASPAAAATTLLEIEHDFCFLSRLGLAPPDATADGGESGESGGGDDGGRGACFRWLREARELLAPYADTHAAAGFAPASPTDLPVAECAAERIPGGGVVRVQCGCCCEWVSE